MSEAVQDIAAERQRQIESEGWDTGHDDEHEDGQLAMAAACYATSSILAVHKYEEMPFGDGVCGGGKWVKIWPWDKKWWKPKDRRRDLVRAGALIVAEIERLDRIKP
jgi:hypothetical protein